MADINARASFPGIRLGDLMGVHDTARLKMIENQLRPNKVTDERVIGAFARLRRELFVPLSICAASPMSTTTCRSAAGAI